MGDGVRMATSMATSMGNTLELCGNALVRKIFV